MDRLFLTTSRTLVIASDWNGVLDPGIDRIGARSGTKIRDVKTLQDFIDKFGLLDKYRNKHIREAVWT